MDDMPDLEIAELLMSDPEFAEAYDAMETQFTGAWVRMTNKAERYLAEIETW